MRFGQVPSYSEGLRSACERAEQRAREERKKKEPCTTPSRIALPQGKAPAIPFPQSSSGARFTAGAAGFLNLRVSREELRERYGESTTGEPQSSKRELAISWFQSQEAG